MNELMRCGCWTLFSSAIRGKCELWRAISPRDNEYIATTDAAEIKELAALLETFLQERG